MELSAGLANAVVMVVSLAVLDAGVYSGRLNVVVSAVIAYLSLSYLL